MMHAENGIAIDVLVAAGARPRRDRPGLPRADPAAGRLRRRPPTGRSCSPTSPARRSTSCTCRRKQARGRDRRGPRRRARTSSARPARSTCTCRWRSSSARPGFEGAKWVCSHAAARRGPRATRTSCGEACAPNDLQVVSHRPLPVLHEGPEGAGHRRLLQDPQRHRLGRAPDGPALPGRRRRARSPLERWVEIVLRRRRPGCSACTRSKGVIAPGADADIVVYDPNGHTDASASARPTT